MVGPQQLFDIAEEGLDLSAHGSPAHDLPQGCVQLTRGPVACLRFPDDEDLTTAQFAHPRRDQVSRNFAGGLLGRPDHLPVPIGREN